MIEFLTVWAFCGFVLLLLLSIEKSFWHQFSRLWPTWGQLTFSFLLGPIVFAFVLICVLLDDLDDYHDKQNYWRKPSDADGFLVQLTPDEMAELKRVYERQKSN